ncbi:MAG TPA: hypothetical protein VF669_06020 [Tepidisphaeraceae bacterium]|jgi:hypothetical protein
MKESKYLAAILVLQGLILVGQWTGNRSVLPAANAGDVPNPAQRQMELLEEMKTTNTKLDRIIGLMEGGELQVKVVQSDENKGTVRRK